MRKLIVFVIVLLAAPARAQQIALPAFERLAASAKETTNIDLDASTLQLAGAFLSNGGGDEAAAKKLVDKLKAVYVRVYEFDRDGAYSPAELQPVRDQLTAPQWRRIVTTRERDSAEEVGVWVFREGADITGLVVLATEPREVTIVNVVGPLRLEDLSSLGGRLGIPRLKDR